MLTQLTSFEKGALPLDVLVANLEGLLNALESIEPSWRHTFLNHWGKLEDENAFAIFKGTKTFEEDATSRLLGAVSLLKYLVLEKIDDSETH